MPQETPEETPEPIEDERDTLLLRGLSPAEQLDAERFARIAATLALCCGMRPLDAWTRASVLADESEPGDPLPVLFAEGAGPRAREGAASLNGMFHAGLATPPERRTAPPPASKLEHMVPRETTVRVDLDDEEPLFPEADGLDPEAYQPHLDATTGRESPAAPSYRRGPGPRRGRPTSERTTQILALLGERPRHLAEMAALLAVDANRLGCSLSHLKSRGLLAHDGHGGAWRLPGDDRPAPAKATRAPAAATPSERICRCNHPESAHVPPTEEQQANYALLGQRVALVCRCGCEKFRPIKSAAERRAEDAKHDRTRGLDDAEHAVGECPARNPRGHACGKPGLWDGTLCTLHGQRRERGEDVPLVAPIVHRDVQPENTTRAPGTGSRPNKETVMTEEKTAREIVIETLRVGPKTCAQLRDETGLPEGTVSTVLAALRRSGEAQKQEGYGGPWSLTGKEPLTMAEITKKAAKRSATAKKARANGKAAKANGHANGHAAPAGAVQGALAALAAAFQAEHEASAARLKKKLDAIAVLAEQE